MIEKKKKKILLKRKKGPKTTVLILGIGTGQAKQPPIISREGAGTVSIKSRE